MKTTTKKIPEVTETFTYRSIKDTPNNLKQILEMESRIEEIAGKIKNLNPKKIYFTGNGSSFHASEYAEFLFNNFVKIPTTAKTSLDYVYYTEGIEIGSVTFIISVSGSKGDATAIAKKACDKGSYVVAITNTPGSELVKMANESFVIPSGKAESFINTKGYMAQLFVIALLVKHLSNNDSENFNRFVSEIYALPDKMRESFKSEPKIKELIALEKDKNILVFSGKGPSKVVSDQTALKLRETAWTIKHSESIPIDEIPHGRLFCLGDEGTLFILMVSGETAKDKVEKVSSLIEKTGAHTISFCDTCYSFKHHVTLPKTHEYLFPILAQAVSYLWVCYMNDVRGLNIDEPRNVAMVDKFLQEKEAKA
jgi:glucosamine--fructose-6-phosphate aminotransferase (isomerizing)